MSPLFPERQKKYHRFRTVIKIILFFGSSRTCKKKYRSVRLTEVGKNPVASNKDTIHVLNVQFNTLISHFFGLFFSPNPILPNLRAL